MARLPNSARAILDISKIEDYCLDPQHPRGHHKARLFRGLLGRTQIDSPWLRDALLGIARSSDAAADLGADAFGRRWWIDVPLSRHGKTLW